MTAPTTQAIRLLDCPACGEGIVIHTTYAVHLGDIEPSANAKVSKATATLTMTGARVHHECPPKPKGMRGLASGGITIDNPVTRED